MPPTTATTVLGVLAILGGLVPILASVVSGATGVMISPAALSVSSGLAMCILVLTASLDVATAAAANAAAANSGHAGWLCAHVTSMLVYRVTCVTSPWVQAVTFLFFCGLVLAP